MTEVGEGSMLRLSRRFEASREQVFDAWTDPAVLERWWAAQPSWEGGAAEVDLREGSQYRLSMRDPATGETHTVGIVVTHSGFADDMHAHG